MFWHPGACPHVLPTIALPAHPSHDPVRIHLLGASCRVTLLPAFDGLQHILLRDGARALQLVVSGTSLIEPVQLLTHAFFERSQARARLQALTCLNDLRAAGRLLPRHFPAEPRGRRLRVILQALDGWLAGASYREIAIAIFGRSRVETDWTDPRRHLRDQVRRAVRRGRALMGGGYRTFLS